MSRNFEREVQCFAIRRMEVEHQIAEENLRKAKAEANLAEMLEKHGAREIGKGGFPLANN